MPKYVYNCKQCEEHFEIYHGMMEEQESCIYCSATDLLRVPQMPFIKELKSPKGVKVGEKTKDAIEANRELLKEMKERASKDYFRNDN